MQVYLNASTRLFLLMAILFVLAACGSREARVVFNNVSACGAITINLIEVDTNTVIVDRESLAQNATRTITLKPDTRYRYEVDFRASGTLSNRTRCTAVESGTVTVPAGSTQSFNLASQQ